MKFELYFLCEMSWSEIEKEICLVDLLLLFIYYVGNARSVNLITLIYFKIAILSRKQHRRMHSPPDWRQGGRNRFKRWSSYVAIPTEMSVNLSISAKNYPASNIRWKSNELKKKNHNSFLMTITYILYINYVFKRVFKNKNNT